jgi:hypothetical protein
MITAVSDDVIVDEDFKFPGSGRLQAGVEKTRSKQNVINANKPDFIPEFFANLQTSTGIFNHTYIYLATQQLISQSVNQSISQSVNPSICHSMNKYF